MCWRFGPEQFGKLSLYSFAYHQNIELVLHQLTLCTINVLKKLIQAKIVTFQNTEKYLSVEVPDF